MIRADWIEQLPQGIRQFVSQLQALHDFPYRLAQFADVLRQRDHHQLPAALARRAWALAPYDARVRVATAWAMRQNVPRWHFPLVHDQGRNTQRVLTLQARRDGVAYDM